MSNKLFENWTWSRKNPEPFEAIGSTPRSDIQSKYNKTKAAKSTLHSSTLSGIFAYMDRRVGKRTLVKIQDEVETLPEWVRQFYRIRCEADGITFQK